MTDSAAPTPTRDARLAWADVAKGACILLVVLHHTTVKHYLPMVPEALTAVGGAWEWLNYALKPVRMPLFFLLAGMFAAGAVRRPWPQVLTRRVLTPYWLFAVWLAIGGVVFTFEQSMVTNRVHGPGELLGDLLLASTGAWFLYALAVYFVLTKLTLHLGAGHVLGAAALLALAVPALPMSAANRESVLIHLVYFVLGARLPEVVRALGAWRLPLPLLPLLLLGYAGAVVGLDAAAAPQSLEVLLLSVLGVPLAVRVATAAGSGTGRVPGGLAALGRNTLPIYVLHMPVLAALHHVPGLGLDVPGTAGVALSTAYPVLGTGVVVVASWWLHRGLLATGLGWLFTLPVAMRPSEAAVGEAGRRLRDAATVVGARTHLAPGAPLRADRPSQRTASWPAVR